MYESIVYSLENCPNCDRLKATLKGLAIAFEERVLETKEAIVDLRCLGCFPRQAPVLRSDRTAVNLTRFLAKMEQWIGR